MGKFKFNRSHGKAIYNIFKSKKNRSSIKVNISNYDIEFEETDKQYHFRISIKSYHQIKVYKIDDKLLKTVLSNRVIEKDKKTVITISAKNDWIWGIHSNIKQFEEVSLDLRLIKDLRYLTFGNKVDTLNLSVKQEKSLNIAIY